MPDSAPQAGWRPAPSLLLKLVREIFSDPDGAFRIDKDADAALVIGRAEQVLVMSARWTLVDHLLMYGLDALPGIGIRGFTDVLAGRHPFDALVGDALRRTGFARTLMHERATLRRGHSYVVLIRAIGERTVQRVRGQSLSRAIAINLCDNTPPGSTGQS